MHNSGISSGGGNCPLPPKKKIIIIRQKYKILLGFGDMTPESCTG